MLFEYVPSVDFPLLNRQHLRHFYRNRFNNKPFSNSRFKVNYETCDTNMMNHLTEILKRALELKSSIYFLIFLTLGATKV